MNKICLILESPNYPGLGDMSNEIIEELSSDFDITTNYFREGQYSKCTVFPTSMRAFFNDLNNPLPIDDEIFRNRQFDKIKEIIHEKLND
ncbi:hypothetical protein DQ190_03070 [Enterococcus faecium]|uniref:hypothetical protein n=1 Tax=Enterococcus faecium TaxID=1352 RepID=UPI0019F6501B|nr:hypothetical protein [Enterococcus faecium]EGP5463977.1 hypothetical protein [Enterococcus faecium]EGP5468641.1 hypothetical protein [Enterococcus faecium]EGP5737260.1 hypothetical protein [Enterococcus faecium]NTQ56127.1 hypothetical protein [Enterococcus faecium]